MENLSDTYHDPSQRVPKIFYWNADPPKKKIKIILFRGGFTIMQPTLSISHFPFPPPSPPSIPFPQFPPGAPQPLLRGATAQPRSSQQRPRPPLRPAQGAAAGGARPMGRAGSRRRCGWGTGETHFLIFLGMNWEKKNWENLDFSRKIRLGEAICWGFHIV